MKMENLYGKTPETGPDNETKEQKRIKAEMAISEAVNGLNKRL